MALPRLEASRRDGRSGAAAVARYDPPVTPLLLVVLGAGALGAGWLLLRRLGSRARIGRILASTPVVSVGQGRELAERGTVRYVAVRGRVDAEQPFEDEHHRPLVFRRTRLESRSGSGWTAHEDRIETVPFAISEGLDRIAVDGDALNDGLVVVAREAEGVAADVADRLPSGTSPGTPVRLRVELLSAVDHALVLGVPMMDPDGGPILRPGLRRPLILTTLERPDAMRLLAADHRGTTRGAAILFVTGVVVIVTGFAWWMLDALA
jgi:hypothetical protein